MRRELRFRRATTSFTCTSLRHPWSPGMPGHSFPRRAGGSGPSTPTRPRRSPTTSRTRSAPGGSSTSSPSGSPSRRRRPGPGAAGSAASTGSFPTASTSRGPHRFPAPADHLRLLFVGRAEERKGLPVLLLPSGAGRARARRLTVVGADPEEVRGGPRPRGRGKDRVVGRISDEEAVARLGRGRRALRALATGESFGMVLIEAMAAGTPVIASEIAGYWDVVTDGADGILVPPADPQRLAEELQRIYDEPARREAMGKAGRGSAGLRLAADRRRGHRGLRGGAQRPRAGARPSPPQAAPDWRLDGGPRTPPGGSLARSPPRPGRGPRRPAARPRRRGALGVGLSVLAARGSGCTRWSGASFGSDPAGSWSPAG